MTDLNILFDVSLTDQEESILSNYSGYKEVNKVGNVTTVYDSRELEKEKLRYKKLLKVLCNQIFLRFVPLHTQLNAALGQLSQDEIAEVKVRMTKIRQIYQQEKIKIESAVSLDTLVMSDLETIISNRINRS